MRKIRLAIVGAGDYGKQIHHWAEITGDYEIVGYFDDYTQPNIIIKDKPILGKISTIEELFKLGIFDQLFIAIGYKHSNFKQVLFQQLKNKIPFATIIVSPTYIDPTARIGENVLIGPGCIIGEDCIIEDNTKISQGTSISHNSRIQAGTYISPSVNVAGFSNIGQCCFIGIGSTIIDNIIIGNNITIGASALVVKNLTEEGTYIGVPCKKVK